GGVSVPAGRPTARAEGEGRALREFRQGPARPRVARAAPARSGRTLLRTIRALRQALTVLQDNG
ncbi:MAG TPA: hypothetical protein VFH02_08200, partial [Jiangellaceae bacterium]|nr:hypothetical protein [Jiangellaceae bacterium]